jgi:beta-mannosidase
MTRIIELGGIWDMLFGREEKGNNPASYEEAKKRGWKKIEAAIPGNVELDLARAGVEKDPFFGNNLYNYRKYEFYQWWLRRSFLLPQRPSLCAEAILKIDGLNTFATVWLNGAEAGSSCNMLVEHEFDVSALLAWGGNNEITVRLESAMNKAREREYPVHLFGDESHDEMVSLRMPPHSFGWDIMPRFLSAGIWRPIGIYCRRKDRLTDVYYATTRLDPEGAELTVRYRFKAEDPELAGYAVRLRGNCGASIFEKQAIANFVSGGFAVKIPSPELWWPRGYGEAKLYSVEFSLLRDGQVVDGRTERIGIRKTEVQRKYAQGDGGEFKIWVNDTPIMAMGSNWVPLDAFHSRDRERLGQAFQMVNDTGCNILRCWGGNVYEDHDFFDLCDENGVMVWQDFSFACASYPHDKDFLVQIGKEAKQVIRKLRNHPSLLLWAGDNEVDALFHYVGYDQWHAKQNRISREVLPEQVRDHDPYRSYIESSPCIPYDMSGDLSVPEQHNWGPRDYFKGEFYKRTTAHFISEIGYHGCPPVSSLKRYISKEKLWPQPNDEWDTHNTEYILWERRKYNRNALMTNQVKALFGTVPETLEEYVLASQISQAEAKKFFIEMVRSRKWRRTGIIWWNLLDGWPQISDAVVDYYFHKKIAYHYIKRSQAPVCVMIREPENWRYDCIVDNSTRADEDVVWRIENGDTGAGIAEGRTTAKANENTFLTAIPMIPGTQEFFLMYWSVGAREYANHYAAGYIPLDLATYKRRLSKIQSLPVAFDAAECVQ